VSAIIERDRDGYYVYCPELPGCQSQGDTMEEAVANIREAAELYLETLSPQEVRQLVSRDILSTSVEVRCA
jgi:predicted RNase H-like HicB family nuclease